MGVTSGSLVLDTIDLWDLMTLIVFKIVCCLPQWNVLMFYYLNWKESSVVSRHIVLVPQSHMFSNLVLICRVTAHVQAT